MSSYTMRLNRILYDREEEINYGAEEDDVEPKDNGIMNESVQKIKNQFKRFF